MYIDRILLADPIKRGAIAAVVWAAYAVLSNWHYQRLDRPVLLSPYESLFEAALICLLAWGLYRRSRVCAAILLLEILGGAIMGALLLEQYAGLVVALPFVYAIAVASAAAVRHHRENPERSRVLRALAYTTGLAVVVGFAILIMLFWDAPPTRIIPGPQVPALYVAELRALGLIQSHERIRFFYSPALVDIRDEMYVLTDSRLIAYSDEWTSPAIVAQFDQIAGIEFQHDPSWAADSILIVDLIDGTEFFVPLSSEGGADIRFHAALEDQLDRLSR